MPATTPITATYDAGITATLAAMFGVDASTSPTIATTGETVGHLTAYTLDIAPGCLPDTTDLAVSVDADLTGIAPGDVYTSDGFAIAVLDWDGVSPTPLDATPAIISGDDLSSIAPGFGMIGRWYTGGGGTVPLSIPTTATGVWEGTPVTQAVVLVIADLNDTAGPGTLTVGAPTVGVTFTLGDTAGVGVMQVDAPTVGATFSPGSPCAAVVPVGGYRPPVKRYPARADRPSSTVGVRTPFRR